MQIVDLTPEYFKFLEGKASFEDYRSSDVLLFEHYLKYWSNCENFAASLSIEDVEFGRDLVLGHLLSAEQCLQANGFLNQNLRAVLFVGNNTANGHAFLDDGKSIAWFAIECFRSELQAKLFTIHELAHALHYAARPEFFFTNLEEKRNVSRQLITEGIASYLTKQQWNLSDEETLWADAIPSDQIHAWMAACLNSEKQLFQFVAANFESSDTSIELFYGANPENIFSYRAGYFVGLKLIESLASKNDFSYGDLLNIPMSEIKQLIWNELQLLITK